MLKALQVSVFVLVSTLIIAAQTAPTPAPIRIDPSPKDGFSYPYYLYVPNEIRDPSVQKQTHTFLVLPNNTGKVADALEVHEADVKRRAAQAPIFASLLKVAVIMPVFPRPETDWRIYTHALDRDSMVTDKKKYARFDLQLVAMIDDARRRLRKEGLTMDRRVLLNGYSAQGMFANRFAFLHPGRVKAAAIGSPGGWPIAPVSAYKNKTLRYPIGVADIRTVSGKALDLGQLKRVPLLIFLGDKDENDSVVFGDSYDDQDKQLILPLFGAKPVDRWEISKTLYRQAGLNAEFRLYPGIGHTVTPQMRSDVVAFLQKHR